MKACPDDFAFFSAPALWARAFRHAADRPAAPASRGGALQPAGIVFVPQTGVDIEAGAAGARVGATFGLKRDFAERQGPGCRGSARVGKLES